MEKCVCLYFRKSMALKTLMSAPNSVLGQITPSNLRFSNSEKGQPGYSIFKNLSTANLFGNGDSFCSFSKVAEKKIFFSPKKIQMFYFSLHLVSPRQFLELPLDGGKRPLWC